MRLIENNQITIQIKAMMHGVIELVAQYFCRADNDRRFGIFFCIACDDADILRIKMQAELHPFRIGKSFERRGVPGTSSLFFHR